MQPRTTIRDPYSHAERPVVGLQVSFAAALATGKLPRILFGQWTMIAKLRKIPDTVDEFTGFAIAWDPIAGNFATSDPYVATRHRDRAQRHAAGDVQPHRAADHRSTLPTSPSRARGSTTIGRTPRLRRSPTVRPSTCATCCMPPTSGTASAAIGAAKASARCARRRRA